TRHVGPVDLVVEPAQCVCLSGASGSGKTLLLRAIADLDPHQGTVWLDGRSCDSFPAPEWRRQVGLLPAESRWWYERVGEHMGRLEPEWLEQLGFSGQVLEWEVRRCSTGERQRLALLRLLANRPRALLLDEPTASLDPAGVGRMEALLEQYRIRHGAAVLWVSHDPEQIRRVATRHFELQDGRLWERGR
ncbi:MAG TPA: ATP-binding cassette domain-containing protein, partial [Gammaproteobacteria bacterium]|nr:ATP-binding cassette domain-containing protein [Gammaproteobacteria bacterium]